MDSEGINSVFCSQLGKTDCTVRYKDYCKWNEDPRGSTCLDLNWLNCANLGTQSGEWDTWMNKCWKYPEEINNPNTLKNGDFSGI